MKIKNILGCILSLGLLLSPVVVDAEEQVDSVAYTGDNRQFTSIDEAWNAVCDGYEVYMSQDWNTSSRLVLKEGSQAILHMNGHSINRQLGDYELDGEVIYMEKNSSLTITGKVDRLFTAPNYKEDENGSVMADVTLGGMITGGKSKNGAGGIHMKEGCTLSLNRVGVVGNKTRYFDACGGGIQMDGEKCTVNLNNGSMVSYNYSNGRGGGIYVAGDNGIVTMNNSEVSYNNATYGGGIFSNYDATYISLENHSSIHNNLAFTHGGGVRISNSYSTLISEDGTGRIFDNLVSGSNGCAGGGIFYAAVMIDTNAATLKGITFENNEASVDCEGKGGAFCSRLESVKVEDCTFKNNRAYKGGAAYIDADDITFTNCSVTNNSCANNGGGIFVDSMYDLYFSGKVTVKKNVNSNNEANDVYLENGRLTRAYVSGTPDEGSEIGLMGDGECKVGIDQTENNGSFFLNDAAHYHLEYSDGKLYQKNGATGSIFGSGNGMIVGVVLVCVVGVGGIVYCRKKKN